MDLSTTYLGLKLPHPLMPGASPLVDEIDTVRRLEDAGAAMITMHSLFEEQIAREQVATFVHTESHGQSFAEALTYFPSPEAFHLGPDEYLEHLRKVKQAVSVPVVGSLNGYSIGGWLEYAKLIEQAGADALELNVFMLGSNPLESGAQIELRTVQMVQAVRKAVRIPVAVKLSPYYTALGNLARRLDEAGADGLILFNRFYQPDIHLETLEVEPNILLSTPMAMRLPLRWVALLHKRIKADLAATSGIHRASDVIKMLMVGASTTQLCSVLLRHGIAKITSIERELCEWMEQHEYESVAQLQGSLSQINCPDPAAYERAQYMKAISSYKAA